MSATDQTDFVPHVPNEMSEPQFLQALVSITLVKEATHLDSGSIINPPDPTAYALVAAYKAVVEDRNAYRKSLLDYMKTGIPSMTVECASPDECPLRGLKR